MELQEFKKLINEKLSINTDSITLDTDITSDMGIDSIDVMEIIMAIESKYEIRFDDEKIKDLKKVSDVLAYVSQLKNSK